MWPVKNVLFSIFLKPSCLQQKGTQEERQFSVSVSMPFLMAWIVYFTVLQNRIFSLEKKGNEKKTESDPNLIRTGVLMNMQRCVDLEHHRAKLPVFASPVKTLKLHRRVFPPVKNHPRNFSPASFDRYLQKQITQMPIRT